VLDDQLKGRTWLIGERLTIADSSIGALVPTAARLGLPLARFSEIGRWYEGLAALPAWQDAVAAKESLRTGRPHSYTDGSLAVRPG
jgi:glutathione S-transferase